MSSGFGLFNTSVMGMAAQSDWLSAISKNIANSNTTGYKEARTDFMTILSGYQDSQLPGGGVTTVSRYEMTIQGALQTTGVSTDIAINGQGYLIVSDSSGRQLLTRAGAFIPDVQGRLVNTAGYYLMGYSAAQGTSGPLSIVQIDRNRMSASPTTSGSFAANLPAGATAVPAANLPSTNTAAAQFTSKSSLTTYDNLGNPVTLDLYFAKTGTNAWQMSAYNHADATGNGFPYANGPLTTQNLAFSAADGSLVTPLAATLNIPGGSAMTLDISKTVQLGAGFAVNNAKVNGYGASTVSGVSIGSDGVMSYQLSNGQVIKAYDIPMADVASPTHLTSEIGNAFSVNMESGQMLIGSPGAGGLGAIAGGTLESSTVDLATQLSHMIIAQRSYTANSQVFQVASDIMQVLNRLT